MPCARFGWLSEEVCPILACIKSPARNQWQRYMGLRSPSLVCPDSPLRNVKVNAIVVSRTARPAYVAEPRQPQFKGCANCILILERWSPLYWWHHWHHTLTTPSYRLLVVTRGAWLRRWGVGVPEPTRSKNRIPGRTVRACTSISRTRI